MTDTRTDHYAALLLRVSLGALFLAHAGLKLFVFTLLERRSSSAVSACRPHSRMSLLQPKFSAASRWSLGSGRGS